MIELLKTFLRLTRVNRLIVKVFTFCINETIREEPDVLSYTFLYDIKKETLIKSIKKIGPNSFLWGNKHEISGPENLNIGENVHISNNSYIQAEGGVTIGNNTHISRNFLLSTISHNYEGKSLPYDERYVHKPVKIGKNVWIGMNVCILPGTIIGNGAIVGMGTTVSGNVPPMTIIGSQKWREIGRRNSEHYEKLDKDGRYGGANGKLYVDSTKELNKIGDRKNGRRSILEVIDFNGYKVVKKVFIDSIDGKKSFENEKSAIDKFKDFNWYPKVYDVGKNYIVYEYIDNKLRLDNLIEELDEKEKCLILNEIISTLLDIYSNDFAHRDFHGKNIFYIKGQGVKIIDFECISDISKINSGFFNSYDVRGIGLDSPHLTGNMCVFNNSSTSISNLFGIINVNQLIRIVENVLIEKLYEVSSTFFTRRYPDKDRHKLRNRYIYNTFDLPYLKVRREKGQRNVKKRLNRFNVTKQLIKGKKVLDLGSNVGGVIFELYKMQAENLLGLEYDKEKVDISRIISKIHGYKNIEFKKTDIESDEFINGFTEKFDVVFCLAIIEHTNRKKDLIHKLASICKEKLFIEGNAGTDVDWLKKTLKEAGFVKVKYLGLSDDEKDNRNNNRPLFVCDI